MTPKVSIIVPVYNAGERLRPCLDSLLDQTLTDIEIILVLDCPTDGSDKVSEEYAEKDTRIRLIHNVQNLNIGFSRNEGLKTASGVYIGFCDHDDWCDPLMFETLYSKAIETGADIVISDVGEDTHGVRYTTGFPDDFSKENYLKALISGEFSVRGTKSYNNCNSVWNQLFKHSLLTDNDICFSDNRMISYEDSLFSIAAYAKATRVEYISKAFYYHVQTGQNEFSSYVYKSFPKVRCYLQSLHNILRQDNLDYADQFAANAFHKTYSSLLNEQRFKGTVATIQLFKQIKSDRELAGWISAFHDSGIKMTWPKRLVLYFLSHF